MRGVRGMTGRRSTRWFTTRFTGECSGRATGGSFAGNLNEGGRAIGLAATARTGAAFLFAGAFALTFRLLAGRDFAMSFLTDFAFVLTALLGLAIFFAFTLPFAFDLLFDFTAIIHILS